jgi:hypothetical protein
VGRNLDDRHKFGINRLIWIEKQIFYLKFDKVFMMHIKILFPSSGMPALRLELKAK